MNDLITRLERAEGPDVKLFEAAWCVVYGDRDYGLKLTAADFALWYSKRARYHRMIEAGAWTDAALTLVPEGWDWELYPREAALIHPNRAGADVFGDAATPALALCIADLRAQQKDTNA